jgi:Rrf2 family protein
MKISTRVEYGLLALTDIAIYSKKDASVSSADIAERQSISQKYLEQIMLALRQGGFVKGQKGSHGGYQLSRPANKIFLSEILNALDNSILADSRDPDDEQSNDIRESVNTCLWDKLNGYMRRFTENMSLADLIRECKSDSKDSGNLMYYI